MAIDFNDTTQPAKFDICTQTKKFNVSITAPVGELLHPNTLQRMISSRHKVTRMILSFRQFEFQVSTSEIQCIAAHKR